MTLFPSRPRALALVTVAGLGLAVGGPLAVFLPAAAAQTVDGAPVLVPNQLPTIPATGMAHTDPKGRHLAPHDTFYILSYTSAKTDKGVTGFVPGQEVKLVSVDYDRRMLTVTDGQAKIELSPGQLTNDLDIAAMVRQNDQNGQAQIAAHVQAEEAAYRKYEREQAEASARDLKRAELVQIAEARATQAAAQDNNASVAPAADTSAANVNGGGYYGAGGYGYGNPYSYFLGGTNTGVGGGQRGNRGNNANAANAQGTAAGNGAGRGGNGGTPASATGTATSATAGAGTANNSNATSSATGTATSATAGATGGNRGTAPSTGSATGTAGGGGKH